MIHTVCLWSSLDRVACMHYFLNPCVTLQTTVKFKKSFYCACSVNGRKDRILSWRLCVPIQTYWLKQTTSFHTKEGIASIFSVVDWRPSVWTEWRPLSSGHQTTIRHKNIHKCDPLFPGWGWYLSKQSNAGTEVENFVKSWIVTPGTWDGTGDLAVCAIFPFVIFIQIGERNGVLAKVVNISMKSTSETCGS